MGVGWESLFKISIFSRPGCPVAAKLLISTTENLRISKNYEFLVAFLSPVFSRAPFFWPPIFFWAPVNFLLRPDYFPRAPISLWGPWVTRAPRRPVANYCGRDFLNRVKALRRGWGAWRPKKFAIFLGVCHFLPGILSRLHILAINL